MIKAKTKKLEKPKKTKRTVAPNSRMKKIVKKAKPERKRKPELKEQNKKTSPIPKKKKLVRKKNSKPFKIKVIETRSRTRIVPITIIFPEPAIFVYLKKATVAFLLIMLNWFGINGVGETYAYFNDTETSYGNYFSATDLDLSADLFRPDGFRTQTQGGWGTSPCGDNPGRYLETNFDLAFPSGITIGSSTGFYAYFASSTNIRSFLPAGKKPARFKKNHINPYNTEAGILAGQTLALALNLGFDSYDPDFGRNSTLLRDFKANSEDSLCRNMTAGEVLNEANIILSGGSSSYSPSEINECATEINERFVDGQEDKVTPYHTLWREIIINKKGSLNFQHSISVAQVSGDSGLCQALEAKAYLNGNSVYEGKLLSLNYEPVIYSSTSSELKIIISLPINSPRNLNSKTCGLKYVINGWQENFVGPGGFSDSDQVIDSISSGKWGCIVMNEFLPKPFGQEYGIDFGNDDSLMPKGEWLEIYNNDEAEHDLKDWYVQDSSGHTIGITQENSSLGSTLLPALSFMVVYFNKAIMDNEGEEKITLFNSDGDLVDEYEYSGKTYCDEGGNCPGVPDNKSYARIPDGTGEWLDPIPTPGTSNIAEESIAVEKSTNEEPVETVMTEKEITEASTTSDISFSSNPDENKEESSQTFTDIDVEEPSITSDQAITQSEEQKTAIESGAIDTAENVHEEATPNESAPVPEQISPPEPAIIDPV